jgi:hypothetical protein
VAFYPTRLASIPTVKGMAFFPAHKASRPEFPHTPRPLFFLSSSFTLPSNLDRSKVRSSHKDTRYICTRTCLSCSLPMPSPQRAPQNTAGLGATDTPLLIIQGDQDDISRPSLAANLGCVPAKVPLPQHGSLRRASLVFKVSC